MDLSIFYLPAWREGYGMPLTRFYEEMTETVKQADRLGWARILTTEHHFTYYGGAIPNPAVIMAAWARETENIRLAPGVSLMQLRDPLKVAEDYAMVDQLSGGRCDMGVAKGFVPHEFEAFHIDIGEVPERIAEGLEICRQFWRGEPFSHKGRFFEFDRIQPWPWAINGSLPIWNAASNSRDSFVNAGERGYHLMMNQYPMSVDSLMEKFGWYCEAWEAAGHKTGERKAMVAFMTHIADTEEQAFEEALGPLVEHVTAFQRVLHHDEWNTDYEGDVSILKELKESDDWREVLRRRTLIGTAEQAAERLAKYRDAGFTEFGIIPRYTGITHEQATANIQRVNDEVMPMLGERPAAEAAE